MKKILGILGLLVVVFTATALLNHAFVSAYNLQNLVSWTSLFAIIPCCAACQPHPKLSLSINIGFA